MDNCLELLVIITRGQKKKLGARSDIRNTNFSKQSIKIRVVKKLITHASTFCLLTIENKLA